MTALIVAAAAVIAIALVFVVVTINGRARTRKLAEILELPYGERDVPVEAVTERSALVESTVALAGRMVSQLDTRGSFATSLERAQIPVRVGEYVTIAICMSIAVGGLLVLMTEQWAFAGIGAALTLAGAWYLPKYRIARRRRAFEEQLPDALSLIAGSLTAGHTFLRAVQMMCEEAEPPLAEEFQRVVSETQLGDSLIDALERMAQRLEVKDMVWVVQAIRIQQTVGGKLADLLYTLADFIRAREEIRREIMVLTAEGRISAWVLGALPVFLLIAVSTMSPDYMDPMFRGWGLFVLGMMGASVAMGVTVILRMVKIDV